MNCIFEGWKTIFYSLAELYRKILFSRLENKIYIFLYVSYANMSPVLVKIKMNAEIIFAPISKVKSVLR